MILTASRPASWSGGMVRLVLPFFNELDVLEIQLSCSYPYVDQIVICESPEDFQGRPKPLFYRDHARRYAPFEDKITHIIAEPCPQVWDQYSREHWQRVEATWGVQGYSGEDIIVLADCDELVDLSGDLDELARVPTLCVMQTYCFFLNLKGQTSNGAVVIRGRDLRKFNDLGVLRVGRDPMRHLANGWHFTFLGGVEAVQRKLAAYAHPENNKPEWNNPDFVRRCMTQGKMPFHHVPEYDLERVTIDETFPEWLQENHTNYPHLIT